MNTILVLLQTLGESLHPACNGVIASATTLAQQGAGRTLGVLFAPDDAALAAVSHCGLEMVYLYRGYSAFEAEAQCAVLLALIHEHNPDIVLASASPEGRTLLPMVAARCKTGVTADCTNLSLTADGLLLQTRPAFGGKIMADIVTATARPQMATLRSGASTLQKSSAVAEIVCRNRGTAPDERKAYWVEETKIDSEKRDVIWVLGAGIANQANVARFAQSAKKHGAALFCSCALVERGWLPRTHQIGLSGQSVSPKLLVTFGVSGSVQFLVGIEGATRVVAVDINENAPIMRRADVPIVCDCLSVLEVLECN